MPSTLKSARSELFQRIWTTLFKELAIYKSTPYYSASLICCLQKIILKLVCSFFKGALLRAAPPYFRSISVCLFFSLLLFFSWIFYWFAHRVTTENEITDVLWYMCVNICRWYMMRSLYMNMKGLWIKSRTYTKGEGEKAHICIYFLLLFAHSRLQDE